MEYFPWPTWAGCLAVLPRSTCSSDEYEKLEKSPSYHGNNGKHQCYQHSSPTKSKIQQLLRGKLTLSQMKPGQERAQWLGEFTYERQWVRGVIN